MKISRRSVGFALLGAGVCLLVWPTRARSQDQAPNRRDFTITAKSYDFAPDRIEVTQDDLVKITVRSEDEAHSFVIDGYRIM